MQQSRFKSSKAARFLENLAATSDKHPHVIYSEILKEYEYLLEVAACTYQELEEEITLTAEKSEKFCKLYQDLTKKWTDVIERRRRLESGEPVPPGQSPIDIINYESLKQLESYTQLQLQIQILEFQLDLQKALSNELIPYLKILDPEDEHFSSIFRKLKGLLCFGGETFPSLVKYDDSDEDGVDDENDLNGDEDENNDDDSDDNSDDENDLNGDEDEKDDDDSDDNSDNSDDSDDGSKDIPTSSSAIT